MYDFPNPEDSVQWGSEAVAELLSTIDRRTDVNVDMVSYDSVVFTFEADVTPSLGADSFRFEIAPDAGNMWLHHRDDDRETTELWSNTRGRR